MEQLSSGLLLDIVLQPASITDDLPPGSRAYWPHQRTAPVGDALRGPWRRASGLATGWSNAFKRWSHVKHTYRLFLDCTLRPCAKRTTEPHCKILAFIGPWPIQHKHTRAQNAPCIFCLSNQPTTSTQILIKLYQLLQLANLTVYLLYWRRQ